MVTSWLIGPACHIFLIFAEVNLSYPCIYQLDWGLLEHSRWVLGSIWCFIAESNRWHPLMWTTHLLLMLVPMTNVEESCSHCVLKTQKVLFFKNEVTMKVPPPPTKSGILKCLSANTDPQVIVLLSHYCAWVCFCQSFGSVSSCSSFTILLSWWVYSFPHWQISAVVSFQVLKRKQMQNLCMHFAQTEVGQLYLLIHWIIP